MINILKAFAAGFLATLLCHQPVLWLLHAIGFTPMAPYSFAPTKPLGVPSVISIAFWGGVWGIALLPLLRKLDGPQFWLAAAVVGAIAPTLVFAFVAAPLKGVVLGGSKLRLLAIGLTVNAAWGLGTAAFMRLFRTT